MKHALSILAAVAVILLSGPVHAQRQPVPIVNHENVAIATSSAQTPTLENVSRAIVAGAQNRKWSVSHVAGQSKLQAKLLVRNKHTVVVEIDYSETSYSIRYVSSINMKYTVEDGVPVIHPFYNRWVTNLMEGIRAEVSRL